jgi:hypothetical protein
MAWLVWLQGKKTYIITVVAFAFNLGCLMGWWIESSAVWGFINSLFLFLGIGAIRSGVKTEVTKLQK